MRNGWFAEHGFERTTIRAVAAEAGVDPALVMQYFGTKQQLFGESVKVSAERPSIGDREQLTGLLLATLGVKISGLPETSLAMLRSMLTHPEAAQTARARLSAQVERIGAAIPAEDADLRAALIVTTILGVTIGHQLLSLEVLRDASPQRIADLLRPCLRALTDDSPP